MADAGAGVGLEAAGAGHDGAVDLRFDLVLFVGVEGDVPPGQAGLARAVLQEDESYHDFGVCAQRRG